jgi:hypothetical protein
MAVKDGEMEDGSAVSIVDRLTSRGEPYFCTRQVGLSDDWYTSLLATHLFENYGWF